MKFVLVILAILGSSNTLADTSKQAPANQLAQ